MSGQGNESNPTGGLGCLLLLIVLGLIVWATYKGWLEYLPPEHPLPSHTPR